MPALANKTAPRHRVSMHDLRAKAPRVMRGSYDAAQTTHENANHWAAADHLSANAAHSPAVRQILRNRARYEYANNCFCRGMLLTIANDVVGTGPRLQLLHPSRTAANQVEHEFERWAREIHLAKKLRAYVLSRKRDGESFLMRVTNRSLRHPVKLDLRLVECDHVTSPMPSLSSPQLTDGIILDNVGNAVAYHVLKRHPGEHEFAGMTAGPMEFDTIPAAHMRHGFRVERGGQTRGVPEVTPALPLYALLRRWTLAVVRSAENIADWTLLLKTSVEPDPDDDEAVLLHPMDGIEMERGLMAALPEGYDPFQLKAEQPGGTYVEGRNAILNEIARCLNVPFNIAAGNSGGYNYASGRLDQQIYHKSNAIERDDIECEVLEWLLEDWTAEATRIPGYLDLPDVDGSIDHEWFWDGVEHVDRAKEANGRKIDLETGSTTHAHEYGKGGRDWEKEFQQRTKEHIVADELELQRIKARKDAMERLGLSESDIPQKPDDSEDVTATLRQLISQAVDDAFEERS